MLIISYQKIQSQNLEYMDQITNFARDPFYCGDIEYRQWEVTRRK